MSTSAEEVFNAAKSLDRRNLYILQNKINSWLFDESQTRLLQQIKANQYYVNQCFYDTKKQYYYKIISPFSPSEFQVSVFQFPKKPSYTFEHQMHLHRHYGDLINGKFELLSFEINTRPIKFFSYKNMKRITEEEYNTAFDEHCKFLKKINYEIEAKYEKNKNS